ncbi:MAG: GntR family transcriptional regulator [Clostridia bacterium]|nr:GntR family transcriptional regulator [Clostridia bacterium]
MFEHKTISLADQVFERLESEILTGKYNRGEIITELHLSEDLGVSRTPIREALRRLEQEHLVDISTKGIVIIGVSEEDLEDIYMIRERLEFIAASLAAEKRTEKDIAELRESLELQQYYVERRDADRIKFMDSKFHELVYRISGSTVLYDTLLPLHNKVQKFRKASVQNESRADASLAEHKRIFEAIAAGDKDAAAEAMKIHIINAGNHVIKKG